MPHPLAYLKSAACKVIEGLGPAQIAQSWKLSTRDAIEVIYIAIGEGLIIVDPIYKARRWIEERS